MISVQKQIEQLESLANEAELLTYLACDRNARDQNRRLALELRESALRVRREDRQEAA